MADNKVVVNNKTDFESNTYPSIEVRTTEKSGKNVQHVLLDFGISGNEKLLSEENPLPINTPKLSVRYDDSAPNITYVGYAVAGSLPSASNWQIYRINTANGIVKEYANGNTNFINIWNNRASLGYS